MTPPKARQATVYQLSKTLDLIVLDDGALWLQRNQREPFTIAANEARKLHELMRPRLAIAEADRG